MPNDPLQEAIAASFQDRVARKGLLLTPRACAHSTHCVVDGPTDQGPSGQPSTQEQEQSQADKNGEQETPAPPPRYNIDDCIRELSAAKPAQLPHICDPAGDTWIFIDPPAKQPEQTRVDHEEYRRKFEQPYRMDSARLSQASPFFRDRLAPSAQYRTLRRRRLVGQLPPDIKYVLDLTPPSEGDDAVYLTASLCCPEGVRFWYQAGDIWQVSDSLVGGQEEYHSQEGGDFRKLIASPLEYSPIGHRSAVERVLAAIQGMNVRLDSAVKVWMMTVIAEHFKITQSTCPFLTDSLLTWLRAEPNFYFLEINPEISLRIGKIIENENLYRDAFAILVGEEALDSLARERLPSPQKQAFSTCGRRKVDLPEELVQRIEYASKAFIERNLSDFDRLIGSEMLWLEDLPTMRRLATFTDHDDLVPIAVSLKVIAKCYMRHILLRVLCDRGESFTGLRLPDSKGELLLPQKKRKTILSHLSFLERIFTRTFWALINDEMRNLRQNADYMASHIGVSGNEDIIARSLQEQYVPSYSVDDHPLYRQSHLLEVAANGQTILNRKASTSTQSKTGIAQQRSGPIEIAGQIESEGPETRLPFRMASQQPGENSSSYDRGLSDGMLAPLPVQHQYESLMAYPNVEGEANPVIATQSAPTGHDSVMPHRGPTRDQIAARMSKYAEEQERIDGQQVQAWRDWKAHMDGQGKELMDDIDASKTGSSFTDDMRSDTTSPDDERPFPWEWDRDMGDTDSLTLGQIFPNEAPEANPDVFPIRASLRPPGNPFFDVKQFLREAASHVSGVASQKLSSADAGPRSPRGDPYNPGVINTLTSLDESEWKYCPLEFGGYDDGTGAVFSDDIMEAMPDAAFSTAGPSIHTGSSTYSSADSNDFDMLSDAGSSAGTINTSTAVADGYSGQLDRHRTYANSSVGGHSDDLEMDGAASDDEVRMARQHMQALEVTEVADAKAAAAAQAAADKGKQRADAIDSDYSDLFGDVDPADDDDDGDNAPDYDSDDTESGDGFELI